jgi:hypothetical protein
MERYAGSFEKVPEPFGLVFLVLLVCFFSFSFSVFLLSFLLYLCCLFLFLF